MSNPSGQPQSTDPSVLDARRVSGRGPERGQRDFYHFETYDLSLKPGDHQRAAQVHSLGRHRPWVQVSIKHALVVTRSTPVR